MTPEPHPTTDLSPAALPEACNYIAAFLTFACNLRCSYCINRFNGVDTRARLMSGTDWLRGLNRLESRPDLPVTLQGGEPSLHPDFYTVIEGLRADLNIDLLTNLQFDIEEFMRRVPPARLRRDAPYASIRVSYHPETMDLAALKAKTLRLLDRGYSIGIWAVQHPTTREAVEAARAECLKAGIDFRLKEFLGYHEGRLHGHYRYPEAVSLSQGPQVLCRTTELIIGPSGHVFRCHSDLYAGRESVGHILAPGFQVHRMYRLCAYFGFCNPCDVKIKTDRFQRFGHTSVDVHVPSQHPPVPARMPARQPEPATA